MHTRKVITALAVGVTCAGLVPVAMAGASAPPGSSTGGGDYCAAHVALEAAFNGDDPSAIGPAVQAAQAVVPAEIKDALATAIANAPTNAPPTAAFNDAYNTVLDWVVANCGFNELDVLAKDYSFGGVGAEIPAGTTVIRLDNQGTEYHEFQIIRKNDGVTDSALDLLQNQAMSKVTIIGSAFAAPGTRGGTVVDLPPGNYFAACFIPKGTTPATMEQAIAASSAPEASTPVSSAPEGPPHWTLGMVVEFTVVEGGATTASSGSMTMTSMDMTPATTG